MNPDIIIYDNIRKYVGLPFDVYLQLPGMSHSWLKNERNGVSERVFETENMTLGKLVDGILTEPATVDIKSHLYPAAKAIAAKIREKYGHMLPRFEAQVCFTATIHYKGFSLDVKGRLDYLFGRWAVIDLKVTQSKDMVGVIKHMGYENQLWHYSKMAEVPVSYLMSHSVPLKDTKIFTMPVPEYNHFWAEAVLNHGKIAA